MAKGWYVLHTFTGYENKVEKFIRMMMEDGTLGDAVFDVKVPSEEVTEVRNGKKRTVNRKFLPGYILVEMDLPDRGWKIPCGAIRKIQGVTGFIGSGQNSKPQPISAEEAKSILQRPEPLRPNAEFSPNRISRWVKRFRLPMVPSSPLRVLLRL
jgi:transcriptional antiterminator NusG